MGGIFVRGSTTWLSLAEDRTAYGSRGVGITCSVELKGRLQNNLPGFEELSMLLPRREGGVYPGGFLALVYSCPSCLFLFRITVPFPIKTSLGRSIWLPLAICISPGWVSLSDSAFCIILSPIPILGRSLRGQETTVVRER